MRTSQYRVNPLRFLRNVNYAAGHSLPLSCYGTTDAIVINGQMKVTQESFKKFRSVARQSTNKRAAAFPHTRPRAIAIASRTTIELINMKKLDVWHRLAITNEPCTCSWTRECKQLGAQGGQVMRARNEFCLPNMPECTFIPISYNLRRPQGQIYQYEKRLLACS